MIDIISYFETVISDMCQKFDILEVKETYTPEFYQRYIKLLSSLVNLIEDENAGEESDGESDEESAGEESVGESDEESDSSSDGRKENPDELTDESAGESSDTPKV